MNIDIKDIITLDDTNQYVVVSKALYNDETYFYIIDINNNENLKILKLNKENDKLAEFNDENLIKTLLPLFFNETTSTIDISSIVNSIE